MMAMNLKTIINISGSHKRPNLISMSYWVRKVLKAVIVLVGRGEQILFQIQLTSALKDLAQLLPVLVSLGLQMCECGKYPCRVDFMTLARVCLWPSGKVSQSGWRGHLESQGESLNQKCLS